MVGKTSISTRFIKGQFIKIDPNDRTVNTNVFQKNIEINNKVFNLTVWDTAGEEKYHALAPIFYRGTHGAVIIFDVTNRDTFQRATKWFGELKEFSEKNTQMILVGNKIDLPDRVITNEEASRLARKYNCNFLEVSALIYQAHKNKHKSEKMEFDEDFNINTPSYGNNRSKKLKIGESTENAVGIANSRKDKNSCC